MNTFWQLLVVDRVRILNTFLLVGSITKPAVMFAEASPSLRIEPAFPQGIQEPALTAVWGIGDIAVRDQQSEEAPWDWYTGDSPKWLMTRPSLERKPRVTGAAPAQASSTSLEMEPD